ncbi:MAG: FG-GAP repeat domain-containing protein [Desulfobulbaceae bacterium]
MKASTSSLRGTQTSSLAEYLRERRCSLLPAESRGEQAATWGWRRLAMLFRSRLLEVIAGTPRRSRLMAAAVKAASVALATGLALAQTTATARAATIVFTEAASAFAGVIVGGGNSTPTFVDIDGDGDMDAFVGEFFGTVKYFENTGSTTAPAMVERTGLANPLNGVDVFGNTTPTFADIDGDGDMDAFIGEYYGTVLYYKNTGSALAPVMVEQTGPANPFSGVDIGYYSTPTFVDIDGDGDLDAFIGEYYGMSYFENTGSKTAPVLVERTGAANPLGSAAVSWNSIPTFADIDGDGDLDAFIGEYYGTIKYFENTGSKTAPVLTEQTGTANPFSSFDVGYYSAPTFADIDGDGDLDAFIGEYYGTVRYFRNDTKKFPWAMFLPAITSHSGASSQPASYWSALSYLYCPSSATTFSLTSGGVTKKSVMPAGGSSGGSGTFEGWVTTTPGAKAFSWQLTSPTCGSWTGNFSYTLQDMKNYSFSMDLDGASQPAVYVSVGNGKPATAASKATSYAAVDTIDWSAVAFKGGLKLADKLAPVIQPEMFKSSRN